MSTNSLRFRLFGPLGVDSEAESLDPGPPKQRAVLAVLLLHANEIVSTDRIIDSIWRSPPRTAEHSVQIYISNLRKTLSDGSPSDLIETRPPGYRLTVSPDAIDSLRFERLVREGLAAIRDGDPAVGRSKLEDALAVWTASPLAEFAYEEFAQGHIRSLGELRSDALEALAGVHLKEGNFDAARDLARRAIEVDPLREEPHRVMMLTLYNLGRQAEALRAFGDYQSLLGDQVGLEPSDDLRDLEERVLLQDPSLSPSAPDAVAANPYRGLRAFSEDDADVYFGRENLVAEVLEKLDEGAGFVSVLGPSGSGKSSAAQAGVIPVLRSRGETVILLTPGPRPLHELASALDRAGFGAHPTLLHRFQNDPRALAQTISRSTVLVIDQFEELFTLGDSKTIARFSDLLATAVEDKGGLVRVVATLRADYFDKPLSVPSLAGVFSRSVVSVRPMAAQEIERAVVEPARMAGVDVEPALLAQLVADMGGEPGALPIFQFTLFELFDRTSHTLTLADYVDLGGIQGALTFRADELMEELDAEGRDLVEQVMVRMIRKGGSTSTARPVPLRDLLDLGVDPVALQAVLDAFGSRRLLTFDRGASGAPVVEIAHEYLITEWPKLVSWIEKYSDDLDRLHALDAATAEWVTADHSEDYLLRGERLKGFEEWRAETGLRLTRREVDFLEASIELRDRPIPPPDVILLSASEDDSFGRLISRGLSQAVEKHGMKAEHFIDDVGRGRVANLAKVDYLLSKGTPLAVLTAYLGRDPAVQRLIKSHPDSFFLWVDRQDSLMIEVSSPNQTSITSRHEEMGFLAGVVAAHKTTAGHVGIVVGVDAPFMHPFQQGFEQGVSYVDSAVKTSHVYLSQSWDGFVSETLGGLGARLLIDEGADVVFHAASRSGEGVFNAIHSEYVRTGRPLWAIGVDEDEHAKFEEWKSEPWASSTPLAGWQERTLTSIVKRLDLVVFEGVDNYLSNGDVGEVAISIESGGIDYVTTGGLVGDIVPRLEAAKEAIRSGSFQLVLQGLESVRHLQDLIGR
ncbi:MAG TPA: BTAD domain-containing putative transcriptional regulator [Acidimicrobiia bacterium]|nr:BTAD domain-containing putative transcriptional regulator [Acidimicrobiia bacterium]